MSHPVPARSVSLFMGSPRKNSNTHILVQEAERALCARGIRTKIIFLDDLTIYDCRGCHACKQGDADTCVIMDDMQEIYPIIRQSDGFIVASPVYFGYVPSMTKAWLDRLVPFIGADMSPKLPGGKTVSFIFV